MGVAFGLLAALFWGLADSNAAIAGRRIGSFQVVVGFHLLATLVLGVLAWRDGALGDFSHGDLAGYAWVGALGALSYATFYKSLEIGPISINSPVISSYAAISVVLAVVIAGESLSGAQTGAIAVVMAGMVLASADLRQMHRIAGREALGLVLALVTAVLIGGFVFGNAYYAVRHGWLASLFFSRAIATALLLVVATPARSWRHFDRRPSTAGLVALVAAVDSGGYVALNLGAERAETAVVSAASAPYALIPIAIGVLFLRERPRPVQWAGILGVVCGVVLLGLSS